MDDKQPNHVALFIEWWAGLTPAERQDAVRRGRQRRAYWRARRANVLFGLLEDDAILGVLETGQLYHSLKDEK
jgi:hypothetical protein